MNDLINYYINQIDEQTESDGLSRNNFQEQKNILLNLMKDVDKKLELLLMELNGQHKEISTLKNENEKLKNNYKQMLDQINLYIAELESIKQSNT
ncbi:MAG: hypothetical protein LN588_00470 [Rickettsia endosymbiont of Bryobia graminum]|nr:hypothetical protein [Rickettsia endosymbiont of Bryobia graminum]